MFNRWYHKPQFFTRGNRDKEMSWVEQMLDLVFAISLVQFSKGFFFEVTELNAKSFFEVFSFIWLTWLTNVFFYSRYVIDDFIQRIGMVAFIFVMVFTAFFATDILIYNYEVVGVLLSFLFFFNSFCYFRARNSDKKYNGNSVFWSKIFFSVGFVFILSSQLPSPFDRLYYLSIPIILYGFFNPKVAELMSVYPLNLSHVQIRSSNVFFFILATSMVTELSVINSHLTRGSFMVFVSFVILWIYFDNIHKGELKQKRYVFISWTTSIFCLHFSATIFAMGVFRALNQSWSIPLANGDRFLLSGGLGLTLISVGLVDRLYVKNDSVLLDNPKVIFRYFCGFFLIVLFFASSELQLKQLVYWLIGVCFAQICFDNFVSPAVGSIEEDLQILPIAKSPALKEGTRKNNIDNIVQKGTPGNYKRSIYAYLIDGSWNRLIIVYVSSFIVINVMFAMIYSTSNTSVSGVVEGSFLDMFYFSVQTMSTIGYGDKHPETDFGNFIVTLEAMVGILFGSVITGITFAKFSSVGDSVMFSKRAILTTYDGKRTLMFRVGNARGNDIVDARVDVAMLVLEHSKEGHNLRRMIDLKLVRKTSPLFKLTWTVMHIIDDESPLYQVNLDENDHDISGLIVTLTGFDSTYSKTTYGRTTYNTSEIKEGFKFRDVVNFLEDGRMFVDYDDFDKIEQIPTS